ncbi:MAG: ribonuclease HIII [Chitinispirillales bacterium]|jgi:ribonuclease HIII|nr:ribonuclease HIII [Chitinispirillales bacterium]
MKYSSIKQLEEKLCEIEPSLVKHGIFFEKIKDIPYGVQLSVKGQEDDGKVSVYYSPKKNSLSLVEIKCGDATRKFVYSVEDKPPFSLEDADFQAHFGSDEAGKGDFFGPLVTAGFFIDSTKTQEELIKIGVCDSKKLNDKRVAEIAKILLLRYGRNISIVHPSVEKYNEMYSKFKNLNVLLGLTHAMVFDNLKEKHSEINIAVFDKFADESLVTRFLLKYPKMQVSAIVHGENNDIAIAAASIVARNCFVEKVGILSRKYKMKIPLGAGNNVIEIGRKFISKHGRENLKFVAKLHFKTTEKLG